MMGQDHAGDDQREYDAKKVSSVPMVPVGRRAACSLLVYVKPTQGPGSPSPLAETEEPDAHGRRYSSRSP